MGYSTQSVSSSPFTIYPARTTPTAIKNRKTFATIPPTRPALPTTRAEQDAEYVRLYGTCHSTDLSPGVAPPLTDPIESGVTTDYSDQSGLSSALAELLYSRMIDDQSNGKESLIIAGINHFSIPDYELIYETIGLVESKYAESNPTPSEKLISGISIESLWGGLADSGMKLRRSEQAQKREAIHYGRKLKALVEEIISNSDRVGREQVLGSISREYERLPPVGKRIMRYLESDLQPAINLYLNAETSEERELGELLFKAGYYMDTMRTRPENIFIQGKLLAGDYPYLAMELPPTALDSHSISKSDYGNYYAMREVLWSERMELYYALPGVQRLISINGLSHVYSWCNPIQGVNTLQVVIIDPNLDREAIPQDLSEETKDIIKQHPGSITVYDNRVLVILPRLDSSQ